MSTKSDNAKGKIKPIDEPAECVICLKPIHNEEDDRIVVKLRCGHGFHLDYIGSYFNIKNKMECPTCRQREKGEWLFAKPSSQFGPVEFNINVDNIIEEHHGRILNGSSSSGPYQIIIDNGFMRLNTNIARVDDEERRLRDLSDRNGAMNGAA